MKELTEAFNNAMCDMCCVDWSETDGSDVKKILRAAFTRWKNYKPEIVKMFDESAGLNQFQKMLIKEQLVKL